MFTFFFFSDTSTTEIYTLSLHDALPIYQDAVADACVHSVKRKDHLAAVGAVEVERLDDENLAPLMRGRFLRGHNVADNTANQHRRSSVARLFRGGVLRPPSAPSLASFGDVDGVHDADNSG